MPTIGLQTEYRELLADTITPVSLYLKLRDRFAGTILLESSDYHGQENSFSFLAFNPIGSFVVQGNSLHVELPGQPPQNRTLAHRNEALAALSEFASAFRPAPTPFRFITNGLFGYMAYDAVQSFEDIGLNPDKPADFQIPEIRYHVYRNVIAIDHFRNALYLFDHQPESAPQPSNLPELVSLIGNRNFPTYDFRRTGSEVSNFTDADFLEVLRNGRQHCFRGDVFQIVLSRRFSCPFRGDEFNVYRALRAINPSPYLFYFDFGNYKIFGSSPEAQLVIKGDKAQIYPIAGTFKRSGNDQQDAELARQLFNDPKENAEHVMLVDLARNDLSRHSEGVKVEVYKELQFYSHLIHLVSKVTGTLQPGTLPLQVVADTFPAGTLSGAPKYRAMQLIDQYENVSRSYYGGAIGFIGFNGDFNHAIMIRSFLSHSNTLYYQAGAGVVARSVLESELQEVNNKLAALRKAMEMAEQISA